MCKRLFRPFSLQELALNTRSVVEPRDIDVCLISLSIIRFSAPKVYLEVAGRTRVTAMNDFYGCCK